MTATAKRYRSPFVSEVLRETDGSIDDCATSSGVMLAADWTLGEAITRPDGSRMDVIELREALRKVLGPDDKVGGLTLHDVNDALQKVFGLPPLPRYNGQALEPGQSAEGATLRVTWDEFKAAIQDGHVGMLLGIPAGVDNPRSGLRTVQGYDGFKHVIHVSDGDKAGAIVKDPLQKRRPRYDGERIPWSELRQFTEARENGQRAFGSPSAIACALVRVGDETAANRAVRSGLESAAKLTRRLSEQRDQTRLVTDERDQAKRDLTASQSEARLAREAADELRSQLTDTQRELDACRRASEGTPPFENPPMVVSYVDVPVVDGVATLPDGRQYASTAKVLRVPMLSVAP